MAVVAVLLGQALAAAQQLPGQCGVGVVHGHFGFQFGVRQAQLVAVRLQQAVATLGLADVAWHQRQAGGKLGSQLQQSLWLAFTQFQLQLADLFLALAGDHETLVQRCLDHHLAFAATPGDFGVFTAEVGGEQWLDGLFVQVGQLRGPAAVVELLQVELDLVQLPFVLVALGQAGHAGAAALEGLDDGLAIAAQAQSDTGGGELALGGVEVLVEQFAGLPAGLVALFQQRVLAQGGKGLAAGAELEFGFFVHHRLEGGGVVAQQSTGVGSRLLDRGGLLRG